MIFIALSLLIKAFCYNKNVAVFTKLCQNRKDNNMLIFIYQGINMFSLVTCHVHILTEDEMICQTCLKERFANFDALRMMKRDIN